VLLISLVDASRISSIEKSLGRERQRRNTISPTRYLSAGKETQLLRFTLIKIRKARSRVQPRRCTPFAHVSITPTGNFGTNYSFDYGLKRGTGAWYRGEGRRGSSRRRLNLRRNPSALPRRRS